MTTTPLTVAVTGPTGEIGQTFIRALERTPGVGAPCRITSASHDHRREDDA